MTRSMCPRPVLHVTTVHPWDDVRIFHKMCRALVQAGIPAELVALQKNGLRIGGLGDADGRAECHRVQGVTIHLLPQPAGGRTARALIGGFRVLRAALSARPAVIQAHDPELIPWLGIARARGIPTVLDAHEDLRAQVAARPWATRAHGLSARAAAATLHRLAFFAADRILAATPDIAATFPTARTTLVRNFPIIDDFAISRETALSSRPLDLAYIGQISRIRGAVEMVRAAGMSRHLRRLHLVGAPDDPELMDDLRRTPGWGRVQWHGRCDRDAVAAVLGQVRAGLVLLHPLPNYRAAIPVKLLEYLAAGLPVIGSDFAEWRALVSDPAAWISADPLDAASIARAMDRVLSDPFVDRRQIAAVRAARPYDWTREADRYVAVVKACLRERTPPHHSS